MLEWSHSNLATISCSSLIIADPRWEMGPLKLLLPLGGPRAQSSLIQSLRMRLCRASACTCAAASVRWGLPDEKQRPGRMLVLKTPNSNACNRVTPQTGRSRSCAVPTPSGSPTAALDLPQREVLCREKCTFSTLSVPLCHSGVVYPTSMHRLTAGEPNSTRNGGNPWELKGIKVLGLGYGQFGVCSWAMACIWLGRT